LPESAIVFELAPFSERLAFLVVSQLAVPIESIDGSTETTWMPLIELSLSHTKYPVIIESSILTRISEPIKPLLEAPELNKPREASQTFLDIIKKHKLVFKRIKHLLMPERDVHLAQVVQTLDLQTRLLVLDALDQDPDVEELRLVLLLLHVTKDVVATRRLL
jgi:hypothetical protein